MEVDYSILNHSPFKTITNDAARMRVKKGFRHITIKPYTLIAKQNCNINQIGYICSGSILYLSVAENGKIIKKGIAENGNYFGVEGLLFGNGKAMFDILAMTQLECLVIEKQAFVDILQENDRLNTFFKALASKKIDRDFNNAQHLKEEGNESVELNQELRINKSIDFINANYSNQITLDQLAGQAGVSRFYFSRMFKISTGLTFKNYLNTKRLNAAKRLLERPDVNVSQACFSVGFNDASYFSRLFKRHEGICPSTYKNRCYKGKTRFSF
jgi:AraC-like DNA-binding protein